MHEKAGIPGLFHFYRRAVTSSPSGTLIALQEEKPVLFMRKRRNGAERASASMKRMASIPSLPAKLFICAIAAAISSALMV